MDKTLIIAAIALLLSACGSGSGNSGKSAKDEPAVYKTIIAQPADRTLETAYSATLEGLQLVEIRPQVSGTIKSIRFNEGDKIRKGQPLFILDQVPYKAAVEAAEANLGSAKSKLATSKLTLESNRMLYERGVISEYEYQTARNACAEAEAACKQAEASLATARNNLSYTVVTSPVDGAAGMIPYRVGSLVGSSISTPLVTVSDDSRMYAYFSMNENSILDLVSTYGSQERFIAESPSVRMLMSNGQEYSLTGRIDAVSGIVEQGTGAVRVRAVFDNASRLLRSGASATILIPTEVRDCIVIPQAATYEIQEKVFVYKVVDGKATSSEIKVGKLNDGSEYVVLSGMEAGDEIIAEGAGLIREGTKVASTSPAGDKEGAR